MKIYAVKIGDEILRLVRANGKWAALRHCKFNSKVATQDELLDWVRAGGEIEQTDAKFDDVDPRQTSMIDDEVEA